MTHQDPKVGGWSFKEKLTSAAQNLVREAIVNTVDIRGGTHTLSTADVVFTGPYSITIDGSIKYSPAPQTRVWLPTEGANAGSTWSWNVTSKCWQTVNTTSTILYFDLPNLSYGNTLTSIGAWFKGGSGHGGSAPATMPSVTLYKRQYDSATPSTVGSATDTYASAVAFETAHLIAVTGLSEALDMGSYVYSLGVRSEGGANAFTDAVLSALTATITMSVHPPWGP